MGMGEPLANYAATVGAVRRLADPDGMALSQRRITVSTSGLVPQIQRLAGERLEITLAISLHAPTDALRDSLMPINRRFPLGALIPAAREYAEKTGRRISYEYVLLHGVNDQLAQADLLARLLPRRLSHVNLIPYNATDAEYQPTPPELARAFRDRLSEHWPLRDDPREPWPGHRRCLRPAQGREPPRTGRTHSRRPVALTQGSARSAARPSCATKSGRDGRAPSGRHGSMATPRTVRRTRPGVMRRGAASGRRRRGSAQARHPSTPGVPSCRPSGSRWCTSSHRDPGLTSSGRRRGGLPESGRRP